MADLRSILRELERIARAAGSPVRYERIERGEGGLCSLRGRPMIVCDAGLPVVDKVVVVARALASSRVELLSLPPLLRRIARPR